ncbi:MAG TPA: hypothetical protein VIF43_01260 [Patescibacteria group bacterium]|jgi:hypothetical protein
MAMREPSSIWRRLLLLVMAVSLLAIAIDVVSDGWGFYDKRVNAAKELARIVSVPQLKLVPPHVDKISEKRDVGEQCFIRVCTESPVSVRQDFLFPGSKSEIIGFYDRAFVGHGWDWSKGPKSATYTHGTSEQDCVSATLTFEQETIYRLTYTPDCGWRR